MYRIFLNLSIGLFFISVLFSCINDNDDVKVSYGVIRNINSMNNYEILTDKGNTLKVLKSHATQTIENEKRVLVNYEILSDKDKDKHIFDVQVNGFYQLLSKPVIFESFIQQDEENRRDSIGNDPFNQIDCGFGGNYININFEITYSLYSDKKHLINLVYDDLHTDGDTIYFTLLHNAYGEIPGNNISLQKGIGRSSFKISDLLPSGITSKVVKITWYEYGLNNESRERTISGIFKINDTSLNNRLAQHIGFDSSIRVK